MNRDHPDLSPLGAPLARLEALGCPCPSHLSTARFLDLLVSEGLVSREAVDAYLAAYHALSFAGDQSSEEGSAAADRLDREIVDSVGSGFAVDRLATLLGSSARPVTGAAEAAPSPSEPALGDEEPLSLPGPVEPEAGQVAPAEEPVRVAARPRLGRVALVFLAFAAGALVLITWSLAMIAVGHLGHEAIGSLIAEFSYHFLGGARQPKPIAERLDELRLEAGLNPQSQAAWTRYANFARMQGLYADAIAAYHFQLARRPHDAELLNDLAWLYCTAEEPYARDPLQAMALAERAYALDPSPAITDTLAEAAFQNGQVERAIRLEEEALSRVEGDDGFYRAQLQRFKEGLALVPGGSGTSGSEQPGGLAESPIP